MSKTAKDQIKEDEGYRDFVYIDSLGNQTCGWGHLLKVGSKVPKQVNEIFFKGDFEQAVKDYESLGLTLNNVRRGVVINMLFQLGKLGVTKFIKLITALQEHDYEEAAVQMKDSLWYHQCTKRAERLIKMMLTGEMEE